MVAIDLVRGQTTSSESRFASLEEVEPRDEYNYSHFGTRHLLRDAQRTVTGRGIPPGALAPDFELERVAGGTLRLNDLRGKPVLLHFGSYS